METRDAWNCEAATFDEAPDHGLRDPLVRERWRGLLRRLMPIPGRVLDVGSGTGSLSLLLAEDGFDVTGIDFAAAMMDQANAKASQANLDIDFRVGDAAQPGFEKSSFDVILGRHILWAIADISTKAVLKRWTQMLRPGGRLVMIEGFWHTGAGLTQDEILSAIPEDLEVLFTEDLASDPALWGAQVSDERYAIVAEKRVPGDQFFGPY